MSDFMKDLISGDAIKKLEDEQQKILSELKEEEGPTNVAHISEAKQERWQPTEWRPEYQLVVTLSLMNFTGEQISEIMEEKYNYAITRQHVYNILGCDRAKEIRAAATEKVVEVTEKAVDAMLEEAENIASKRIVQVLKDDSLYIKNPFAVFDRAAKVLEGRGKLKRDVVDYAKNQQNNQQNNFIFANLPETVQKRIDEGMKRVALVEELHGSPKDSGNNRDGEKRSGTDG